MSFGQAISSGLNLSFSPYGRTSVSGYWWYFLFMFILSGVIGVIGGFLEAYGEEQVWIGIILQCLDIILVISMWMAGIRRMHDSGRSGWNMCWNFLPLVGWIIVIVMLCKPSQNYDNQYGPVPE